METIKMKKWKCTVCGEIVVSETAPQACPLCKAPAEKFVEVVEDTTNWATEHEVGAAVGAPVDAARGASVGALVGACVAEGWVEAVVASVAGASVAAFSCICI